MLKLIVHHSPRLVAFVCGLHLRLSKPQWQHVVRLADALVGWEARHKTIASLYRLIISLDHDAGHLALMESQT